MALLLSGPADLGKFSHGFQGLRPDLLERLQPGRTHGNYSVRHDTLGWALWDDEIGVEFAERIAGKSPSHRERQQALRAIDVWMRTVAGHHGQPPRNDQTRAASYFSSDDRRAAGSFVDARHALLLGPDIALPEAKAWESALKPLSWWLAGIAVLCDWLGSNAEDFPFRSVRMPLRDYWHKHALPSARKAIQASGLVPLRVPALELAELFEYLDPATPLQALAETLPLADGPQLFILEDVTGAGKTGAALMLAQRLMAKGLGDGLFIALPTMATSNAMFRRVAEKRLDKRIFSGEPGLVLAHSAARLVEHPNRRAEPLPTGPAEMDYAKDEASAANLRTGWIGDSRKKALLADFGIGTLDQALLGIVPVRHQSVRLLGLMRKVLIVDEVHACDDYMLELLKDLLRFQASVGASVLLLSATLPKATRQSLADDFRKGLGRPAASLEDESHPLLTRVTGNETLECPLATRREVVRSVRVERIGERHAVLERLLDIHRAGQCACWVRNSVSDAIDAWRELADAGVAEDRLHLFHARFALGDRLGIEADVLERFGPDSGHDDRRGHILVATQVVEQSLDLDFDWMASDLAPIDLLIQRAGRLRRHCRDPDGRRATREERGEPLLCVFAPEPRDDANLRVVE